jgi:hypothetical protein
MNEVDELALLGQEIQAMQDERDACWARYQSTKEPDVLARYNDLCNKIKLAIVLLAELIAKHLA